MVGRKKKQDKKFLLSFFRFWTSLQCTAKDFWLDVKKENMTILMSYYLFSFLGVFLRRSFYTVFDTI